MVYIPTFTMKKSKKMREICQSHGWYENFKVQKLPRHFPPSNTLILTIFGVES